MKSGGRRLLITMLLLAMLPGTARTEATDTLTVVTLNLWHDQRDWPKRLSVIIATMRELRPDVLCLQEVLQHATLRNQAETLADSLGYHVHFTSVDSVHRAKRYGNAILTRHRVLHAGGKNLDPSNDYRTVAHVRIDFPGRVVDVYDTHLHHTPEGSPIRATQIRDLLAFIDSTRADGAVVLAGDFNAELETPEMRLLSGDFVDAFKAVHPSATREEAVTFNAIFGVDPGAIDHIFVSKAARTLLTPRASEVLFREPGPDSVWASDHFGVVARLEFEARGPASMRASAATPRPSDRASYPPHWWAPVPKEGAPEWEILPQEAGPGEVILSKRHELGLLSNFAPTPFTYRGRRYASLEGFWQMMLYPEDANDPRAKHPGLEWKYTRDQVANMTAFEAKKAGDLAEENMRKMNIGWVSFEGRRFEYRSAKPREHYRLIAAATREKVRQNPEVQKVLLATGDLVLKPDHHQEPDAPPEWRYFEILTRIRKELARKE